MDKKVDEKSSLQKQGGRKGRPKKASNAKKIKEARIIRPENYFFLSDGRVLKDLFELAETLETMNNDVFCHHVNDFRNDFSNWINDIFDESQLADEIRVIRNPHEMQVIILKHVAKKKR